MVHQLETPRLILRRFTPADADGLHPLFCDREAMRLVAMLPAYETLQQTQERILRWSAHDRHFAIIPRKTGCASGYIVINPGQEEGTCEIGFALIDSYRGQGLMREAVTAVLSALNSNGIQRVWACCFEENHASEQLIRSLGFELQRVSIYDAPNDKAYHSLDFMRSL